jgi:RNA-directed DNA polymerase
MGPSIKKAQKSAFASLYDAARDRARLWSAWEIVNRNAMRSDASRTREEADAYRAKIRLHIQRVARALRQRKFKLEPQRAVAINRGPGKSKRPLVVAPIGNRIVQRSLLETLQDIPGIRVKLSAGFNFGGVEGKGVPEAVAKVHYHAKSHPYFARTDISGFFQNVRRQEALDSLLEGIHETDFVNLVSDAARTELDDATKHLEVTGIFPLYEDGVAQGSCLSPLLCNVLLHPLDIQMNDRGVVMIRYIDDFILMAKTSAGVRKAFDSAQRWLSERGLSCYDPYNPAHRKKAGYGALDSGVTFLGCDVSTRVVRPRVGQIRLGFALTNVCSKTWIRTSARCCQLMNLTSDCFGVR